MKKNYGKSHQIYSNSCSSKSYIISLLLKNCNVHFKTVLIHLVHTIIVRMYLYLKLYMQVYYSWL